MASDDREQQFERALTRHLREASPDTLCPDAETLSAYHDRTLSLEEMAVWKEHISGCVRCQEILALVEETEHVPAKWAKQRVHEPVFSDVGLAAMPVSAAAPDFAARSATFSARPAPESLETQRVRRRNWQWIVPIGALAACAIVWVGYREISPQGRDAAMSAYMARKPEALPQLVSPAASSPPAAKQEESSVSSRKEMEASSGRAAAAQASNVAHFTDATKGNAPVVVVTPPAPAPLASGAFSKAASPAPQQQSAPTVTVESQAPAELDSTSSEMLTSQPGRLNLLAMAATDHRYIVAPGEKYAWRVGDSGKIEHTSNRGKTWKPQESGVALDLTGGSATSDKIVWVVGKGGTILLTSDGGRHWNAISSPIAGDLGGIHATDTLHASVWDVPNRNSFQTSDGGVTWNRAGNE
jgi:hypothetical protein